MSYTPLLEVRNLVTTFHTTTAASSRSIAWRTETWQD